MTSDSPAPSSRAPSEPALLSLTPAMRWTSIVSVWIVTAIAAVLIGVFANDAVYLGWLGIAMAASLLVAMGVQLSTQVKRGFVIRFGSSAAGSFVILVIATGILALVHA